MNRPTILLHDPSLQKPLLIAALVKDAPSLDPKKIPASERDQFILARSLLQERLILKYYRDARRGLKRLRPLRFTRAWRSYQAAIRLQASGITTPLPRVLIAWKQTLILGCDQVDCQQLYHALRDQVWLRQNRSKLVDELSSLLGRLKRAKVTHGDLHPRNILFDRQGTAWLIDLDAVRFHRRRSTFAKKRQRDEHRLAKELEVVPGLAEQLGFEREGEQWKLRDPAVLPKN